MNTALRWERLQQLFHAACELPPEARDGFARDAAADDPQLLVELLRMLELEGQATERVQKPMVSVRELLESAGTLPEGTTFGAWAVERPLGQGGMGAVYLVHRADGVYERQAALKLIQRPAMDARQQAFFEVERQTLAQMHHPAIAQILDAGTDAEGRAWLVMEYIEGESISRYCEHHGLALRQRLELFLRLCDGVQHAHQKGVVHRDIKPANVLVEDIDGVATPRLIDFGIAAGIGDAAQPAGTPGYMSPEQADPQGHCDSRCDVYSLGALLYELTVGKKPPTADPDSGTPTPSQQLESLSDDELRQQAERCGVAPTTLLRTLRTDLDWIVRKAMQPDAERRYASVALLAGDVQRHLDGYPPNAAPRNRMQAARKFIARHRLATGAALAVFIALSGGLAATLWALGKAERAANRAQVTAEFLGSVLSSVDPDFAREMDKTLMLRVLDDAARRVATELADDPEGQFQVQLVIAESYTALELPEKALPQLQAARAGVLQRRGSESWEALQVAQRLGTALVDAGHYEESEAVLREAIAIAHANPRIAGPTIEADMRSRLSWTLRQRSQPDEAIEEALRAYDELEARVPETHPQLLDAGQRLAILLSDSGKYDAAIALLQEMISRRAEDLGFDHPRVLSMRLSLAVFHLQKRDYAGAEVLLKAMLEPVASQIGEQSDTLAMIHSNLGGALRQQGKVAEAGPHYRYAMEHALQHKGPEAPLTLFTRHNYANWMLDNGQAQEALAEQQALLGPYERVFGPDSDATAEVFRGQGLALIALGRLGDARTSLEQALRIKTALYGDAEGPLARIRESFQTLEAAEAADTPH